MDRSSLIDAIAEAGRENSTATVLFHAAIAERVGLGPSDHKALDVLLRSGPQTAGELAARIGLSPGSVTALVDRLESRGFVRRSRDEEDRRRVVVEPREEGLESLSQMFSGVRASLTDWLTSYSDAELAVILDFLERDTARLREATRTLSEQDT